MTDDNPIIAGVIALNPLARGTELRRKLLDAWPEAPFGPQYGAYEREVSEAVAIRDCIDPHGQFVFGSKPRSFKR